MTNSPLNLDLATAAEEIAELSKRNKLILFIGAGVSSTIVKLNWNDLINELGESLGYESGLFNVHGNSYELAEYYILEKRTYDDLVGMLREKYAFIDEQIAESKILKYICEIDAETIYTTNYDDIIERAYGYHKKNYNKIVSINDFWKANNEHTNIIKFHGDLSESQSIVLDESSFFERMSMESPLDKRLISDLMEKSILFLGYSLSDINIRYMLYKLQKICGGSAVQDAKRPKLFFFTQKDNAIRKRILRNWNVHTILSDEWDYKKGMEQFLALVAEKYKAGN